MRNLSLTKKELERLTKNIFDYGSESVIIKSPDKTLYKIFKNDEELSEEENHLIKENKYQKIKLLNQINNFSNQVKIIGTISRKRDIVGYEMTYNPNLQTLFNSCLESDDKITVLKRIKEKLLYLESLGITYGDIKSDNILIDPQNLDVSLCDLDNISILNYKMDCISEAVGGFFKRVGTIDHRIHSYMHNLLTLNELEYNSMFLEEELYYLKEKEYPDYFNKRCKVIAKEMLNENINYNGNYFIDEIVKTK